VLLAYVARHPGTSGAREAVTVLDRAFPKLSSSAELVIARSSARSGPAARAVSGFAHAVAGHRTLTAADHLAYGEALAAAGRAEDATRQFALVTGKLAGTAAYQRARLLLNGGDSRALRAALDRVVAKFPHESAVAAPSLYLLADLATDEGDDTLARDTFRRVAARFPTNSWADDARFRAGIIDFVHDNPREAAAQFDSVVKRHPHADESTASLYWAGRALNAAGDSTAARARWSQVIAKDPASYYAILSARRLDRKTWAPAARADSAIHVAAVDQAIARAALLEELGMDVEARFEYDALESAATSSPARLLATAYAFRDADESVRSIRLANRIITSGERDARAYRLLYPVLDREQITDAARAHHIDPGFVAGLIRQESSFNPHAISAAGARGLMQLMPSVGAQLARAAKFPLWNPALLFEPDVNVQLGVTHLAAAMARYTAPARVLAAYNAGDARVDRWVTKAGMSDPEVFAERIPYNETRDYVRIVQRNAVLYDALYGW
jgi:soluble lytic murein transglycosylase